MIINSTTTNIFKQVTFPFLGYFHVDFYLVKMRVISIWWKIDPQKLFFTSSDNINQFWV